ncbi:MAG TPA: hypothetical protein PKY59_18410 [Pyrinomonadaceae bacterium]|nr:hypothetical protein [Pyrinomonadaceae bacterium]
MVKKNNINVAKELNKLNENETIAVLDYISEILTNRTATLKSKENSTDDLINSLSNAYENKRARQVFEWEKTRRQNIQRAA